MKLRRLLSLSAASVIAAIIALLIGATIIALIGKNPFFAISSMFGGALGTSFGLGSTLDLSSVLLLTGLAALVSFAAGIWNLGMEGQLYMGALSAAAVVFVLSSFGGAALAFAYAAGILSGGLYSALAGALKARFKVDEIVSTIMLNYIALLVIDLVAGGPLHQVGSAVNQTPTVAEEFRLPFLPGSTIEPSIIFAILLSVAVAFLLRRMKFGFEVRIMGGNYRAARYVGVNTSKKTVLTMFLSGCLAGLAGCFLLFGSSYTVFDGISKFYGYLGIGVALLAALSPIAAIASAFFFAILDIGGVTMQAITGVPFEISEIMAAIIVIVILVRPLLQPLLQRVF